MEMVEPHADLIIFLGDLLNVLPGPWQPRPEDETLYHRYWGAIPYIHGWPKVIGWALSAALALTLPAAGVVVGLTAYAIAVKRSPFADRMRR